MLNFVAVGHSHIVAIARGSEALQAKRFEIAGEPIAGRFHYLHDPRFAPPLTATGQINPAIGEALTADATRFILTALGGNEHNVLAIGQFDPPIDFILGEAPDLPLAQGCDIMPEAALRETFRQLMTETFDMLRAIRATTDAPIVQVEPPPPTPRAQVLAYPQEFFQTTIDPGQIPPDLFRYKMWRLQSGLYREVCEKIGVVYIETPSAFIDDAGMMAQIALSGDATHANAAYGEAILTYILQRLFRD